MRSNYKRIGDFIELIDERNQDLSVDLLLGLSISKEFIPSVANTVGSNMKNYKIIQKGQFACSIMQVRRDKKMPVALLEDHEIGIISQAYPVFKVKDESELLPQYLMMWFSRPEFDREACFYAVGGVRGSLEWEDFCNMELPVPSIEKQREIVAEYNTVVNRIKLNEQLNQKLEETAQAIYRRWFVEFEFPCLPQDYNPSGQVNLKDMFSVCTYRRVGGLPKPDGKSWFVYVLLCEGDSLYKGMTMDLYGRFCEHYSGQGAKHTRTYKPVKVIHWEKLDTKKEARKREEELKTGYGRTWLSRQIKKAGGLEQIKTGLPAPKTELRTAGKMVWNEELGKEVPEGWVIKTVKEFTSDMKSGGTPNRSANEFWNSDDYPWLKTGELKNSVVVDAEEYISEQGLRESSAKLLPINSILVAMYGQGNTKGQVGYLKTPSTTNQACCAMICSNQIRSTYLYYYMRVNRDQIVSVAIGGAQPNLSKEIIESLILLEPTEEVLVRHPFIKVMNLREAITREVKSLKWMKDLLLSKMTKVEVEKALVE